MKRRIANSNGFAKKYGPKRPEKKIREKSLFCAPTKRERVKERQRNFTHK